MTSATASEMQTHWEKWSLNRNQDSCDVLMKSHMHLVHYHVQRVSVGLPKSVSKEDLISHGMMGLYDALMKFDPSRDLKFDTYASFRIRGAILDGLRKEDWMPRTVREKTKKIEATIETLEQKYLRTITPEEVAKETGFTTNEVTSLLSESFLSNILSIDEENKESDGNENIGFSIIDRQTVTPEKSFLLEELREQLTKYIKELNDKEQLVVSLFYFDEMTLTEIGQILDLSTSRISQIHSRALFKLRRVVMGE